MDKFVKSLARWTFCLLPIIILFILLKHENIMSEQLLIEEFNSFCFNIRDNIIFSNINKVVNVFFHFDNSVFDGYDNYFCNFLNISCCWLIISNIFWFIMELFGSFFAKLSNKILR